MVDSEAPITACPNCTAREIVDTWSLGGKPFKSTLHAW